MREIDDIKSKLDGLSADHEDRNAKVFDRSGKFVKHFSLPTDDDKTELYIVDVATDMNDNIYVLAA